MQYFNGSVIINGRDCKALICAPTKKKAVEIANLAFGSMSAHHFKNYWSDCWGFHAEAVLGEQTECGAFLEFNLGSGPRYFKLEDLHANS